MSIANNKPIVVPWDFSKHSHDALDKALELAGDPSQIHLVHAARIFVYNENYMVTLPYGDIDEIQHARDSFKHFQASNPKYADVDFEAQEGDPALTICEFAKKKDAGLIVISSHGHTGLAHMFLGSVTERVVRHAECPVLVLRSKTTA